MMITKHRGWMKLCAALCLVLAAVLMCAGALAAEQALTAEENRTRLVSFSDGLKFVPGKEPVYENGVWRMTIDAAKTDWKAVIAAGYSESGNVSGFSLSILPDASKKAEAIRSSSTGGATQQQWEEDLKYFQEREPNMGYPFTEYGVNMGLDLGTFDAASGQFLPMETTAEMRRTLFARVRYEDGTYDTRYAKAEIAFSSTTPVKVGFDTVSAENIIPNFGGTTLDATVVNGRVDYNNPTDDPQQITLLTAVKAPGTAADTADWRAFFGTSRMDMAKDANGHTIAYDDDDLPAQTYAYTKTRIITWKDAQNNNKAYQLLTVKIVHGNPAPWPEYVDELVPFAKSDIKLKLTGGVDGTSYRQNGEKIQLAMEPARLVAAAAGGKDLTQAALQIQLKVPKNARYYAGGDTVLGSTGSYGPGMADHHYPNGQYNGNYGELQEITGNWISPLDLRWFGKMQYPDPAGGTMEYFLSDWSDLATEYGGAVQIIHWFDEERTPIGHNYLFFTFDRMELITLQPVLEDEAGLSQHPNVPRAVIKGGLPDVKGRISLKAERRPSGPYSHYYELGLVDEKGNPVYADGKDCDIYLPYPENIDHETAQGLEITIGHYDQNGHLKEAVFSLAMGNLEFTPYGMRLRVTDFSPFVVTWRPASGAGMVPGGGTVQPSVPKTGDSFPLYGVLLCGMLSLAAAGWLLRKARHI